MCHRYDGPPSRVVKNCDGVAAPLHIAVPQLLVEHTGHPSWLFGAGVHNPIAFAAMSAPSVASRHSDKFSDVRIETRREVK